MFKDAKTTVTVIVGAVAFLVNKFFGVGIPETELIAVVLFVIGLLSADTKKADPQ